ncbi:MAG: T9SS C-terminal target domain-containing protein [Ignavibacteriae bacterium]|nr:MAG: T9SS C-terminal target domain-containing protein [Ignavibacteriota bacterium]
MKEIKKILLIFVLLVICSSTILSQRALIVPQAVTPHDLKTSTFVPDSTVYPGLTNVANKTMVYMLVKNISGTAEITSASWTLQSKPSGSNATITPVTALGWWAKFRPDVTGTYEVKVTMVTSAGSKDTTEKFYAATYVGVGNFQGIAPTYPQCMTCHQGMPEFAAIFNKWKVSPHAVKFKFDIDSGSATYATRCFPCHTTGTDHNTVQDNGGFDDRARTLGWAWSQWAPPKPGNWDSLKTKFPALTQFATIGCETCHGPGSEHAATSDTLKIDVSYDSKMCGQCHDEPWRHNKMAQWEHSGHSEAVWSNSFAQNNNGTNNLGNCIRCHDGRGYANFTKGVGTYTNGMIASSQEKIGCAACHDPHGSGNPYSLRSRPNNSDTLATGYQYNELGAGKVCADCHKNRTNVTVTTATKVNSSHWGMHHSVQADVLLGKNAASFGGAPYLSGSHKNVVQDGCIGCHMAPTTDTGTVNRDKVGGHSFSMVNSETGFENIVNACGDCHPGKTNLDQFLAPDDYDGDGIVEAWHKEVDGLLTKVRTFALPPFGVDSVSWELIAADSFNVDLRKKYWNYQLIEYDGSHGMHNPRFAVQVLQNDLIGVQSISNEVPISYALSQNFPNPFNPSTKINFSIPRTDNVMLKIYDINGQEVYTLVNEKLNAGKYSATWNSVNDRGNSVASGVYFYKIISGDYVEAKKMILVR